MTFVTGSVDKPSIGLVRYAAGRRYQGVVPKRILVRPHCLVVGLATTEKHRRVAWTNGSEEKRSFSFVEVDVLGGIIQFLDFIFQLA